MSTFRKTRLSFQQAPSYREDSFISYLIGSLEAQSSIPAAQAAAITDTKLAARYAIITELKLLARNIYSRRLSGLLPNAQMPSLICAKVRSINRLRASRKRMPFTLHRLRPRPLHTGLRMPLQRGPRLPRLRRHSPRDHLPHRRPSRHQRARPAGRYLLEASKLPKNRDSTPEQALRLQHPLLPQQWRCPLLRHQVALRQLPSRLSS